MKKCLLQRAVLCWLSKPEKSIPEIENTARYSRTGRANLQNPENKKTFYQIITFANSGFMELFDFKAVAGDPKTALKEPNTIVITEDLSRQLFNSTDVMRQTGEVGLCRCAADDNSGDTKSSPQLQFRFCFRIF